MAVLPLTRSKGGHHYVYLLSCAKGELYTGYTVDPGKRVHLHNLGVASKFTRSHRPVRLVHLEKFQTKSQALRRELAIKKMRRKEKMLLVRNSSLSGAKEPKL